MGWNWKKYLPGNGYWTGRSDLYKDSERVEYVQGQLTEVKGLVEPVRAEAQSKLSAVNQALAKTGYTVDTGALDQVFSYIEEMVGTIQKQIEDKSTKADEYAKQSAEHPFLTALATGGMVISKFGEGVASAFEDVGDGVATITAGWGSLATDALGITKGANERVSNFIKRDLANEVFTGINDATGITKYSAITADSGFANLSKTAGVATGYLTMGGWLSGVGESMSAAGAGGKWVQATSRILSSTTNANTVIAALGGYGSGMENGLQSGQTFLGAQGGALLQAGIQGGLAYGMGKLGERISKGRQIKTAESDLAAKQADLTKASDAWKVANQEYSNALKSGDAKAISSAWKKLQQSVIDEGAAKGAVNNAQTAVNTLKSTKIGFGTNTQFQGYTDPITNRARDAGKEFGNKLATNIGDVSGKNLVQRVGKYAGATIKTDAQAVKGAVVDGAHALKSGVGSTASAAGNVLKHPINTVKTVGSKAVNAVAHPVQTAKAVATAASKTQAGQLVVSGAKDIAEGGVVGVARTAVGTVGANAINAHNSNATVEFKAGEDLNVSKIPETMPVTDEKGYHAPKVTGAPGTDSLAADTGTKDTGTKDTGTKDTGSKDTGGNNNSGYDNGGDYGGGYQEPAPTPTPTPTDPLVTAVPTTTPTPTTIEVPTSSPVPTTTQTVVVEEPTPTTAFTPGTPSDGGAIHTGGGYSETGGYVGETGEVEPELADLVDEAATSIDDIIKGSKYTKIPTSSTPIAGPKAGSSGSAVIPIAAGLSAAAAAGLGAKAYMDRKHNNENGEDDIYTDDWSDEDSIEVEYDDQNNQEQYLDDDYNYQEVETEKYGARNNEELADLQ